VRAAHVAWAGPRAMQAGEMAGWLQFVSAGVDACIYPGLFLEYLEQVLAMDLEDPVTQWTVKIAAQILKSPIHSDWPLL
jgi:hypothetical protein